MGLNSSLYQTLKNNYYGDALIKVVNQAYDPNAREISPFEWLAMAYILKTKANRWGQPTNVIETPPIIRALGGYDICCCPTTATSNEDCVVCFNTPGVVTSCCENTPCPPDSNENTARIASGSNNPSTTIIEALNLAASNANLPSPWTQLVTNFQRDIDKIDTSLSNAYVYFEAMRDEFYKYADFVNYFTNDYLNGRHAGYYLGLGTDGFFRDGVNFSGLNFKTVQQGDDAATVAVTTITVGAVANPADIQSYVIIYSSDTDATVIWFDVDLSGATAPSLTPPPGVSYLYVKVDLDSAAPPADQASSIQSQLALAPGWTLGAVTTNVDEVIIPTVTTGSKPASVFTSLPAAWSGVFVDGTDGVAAKEVVEINYEFVAAPYLTGKYFTLYSGTTSYMFWYNFEGNDTEPSAPADNKIPIVFNWDFTAAKIQEATNAAIIGTGTFVYGLPPCDCSCKDPGCVSGRKCCACCTTIATAAELDTTDFDGGTAELGPLNQVLEIIDPYNGAVLDAGPYKVDLDYARAWNRKKDEGAFSGPVNYLKSVSAGAGVPCFQDTPCGPNTSPVGDPAEYCRSEQPCDSPRGVAANTILLQTFYPAITEDIPFNTPGTTFVVPVEADPNN